MRFRDRINHAWNAFTNKTQPLNLGPGSSYPMYKTSGGRVWTKSSLASNVFNRIATDASLVQLKHVKVDSDGNQTDVNDGLQYCLTSQANIDQTGLMFIQDLVYSMLDEGVVAVVPIDTTININGSGGFDISTLRVGRITQWYPEKLRVSIYNEKTGTDQEIVVPKNHTAVIESPYYSFLNKNNSTLNRLIKKMGILDRQDEMSASDKLNLIIQMPMPLTTDKLVNAAKDRQDAVDKQLTTGRFGVATIGSTEKITQLNRPLNDKLIDQVQQLTTDFYNMLGMTQAIFDGTADSQAILNYFNNTIDPIMSRITAELKVKFLTKTAITQGHTIVAYRDPFKLLPLDKIASAVDIFSRNAIISSNEARQKIGMQPKRDDPKNDQLVNSNIAAVNQQVPGQTPPADQLVPPDDTNGQ